MEYCTYFVQSKSVIFLKRGSEITVNSVFPRLGWDLKTCILTSFGKRQPNSATVKKMNS
jgi:hypothetical protein